MTGGISDSLVIGFDMSGDDKACLTVIRINGRNRKVINQILDKEAEDLYERLAGLDKEARRVKRNL